MRTGKWIRGGLTLSAALSSSLAVAQTQAVSNVELQKQIAELKAQVDQLEEANRRLSGLGEQVQAIGQELRKEQLHARQTEKKQPVIEAGAKGFSIRSPDDQYALRIGGWIQADGRFYTTGTKPSGSTFLMRRVRPYLTGTVDEFFDFRILADFGQGATTLQDAYADIHYWPQFAWRAGKFKEPIGLERLQDDRYNMFVERALTVNLVPDRDIGVEVHGDLSDQRVEYQLGLFNGTPDNSSSPDIDNNDAKDFAARLFFHPFAGTRYEFARNLGLGVAGSYGRERAGTLDIYRSAGQTVFFTFNKNVNASGNRFRIAPQANYYYGPLGLQAEFVDDVQRAALTTQPPVRTLSNQAWQIAGTYLLTGEDAEYAAPVKPHRDFNPFSGGLGALEVAMRVDQLSVDRDAFKFGLADAATSSREAFEFAFGVNWYLNQNVKFMADYERTSFIWGAANGDNRPAESAILTELQLQF